MAPEQRDLVIALGWGLALTLLAFPIGMAASSGVLPGSFETLADAMLFPGSALPLLYWGGVHDPLQLALALLLNVAFYAVLAAVSVRLCRRR
jgi:hypothetical protein